MMEVCMRGHSGGLRLCMQASAHVISIPVSVGAHVYVYVYVHVYVHVYVCFESYMYAYS